MIHTRLRGRIPDLDRCKAQHSKAGCTRWDELLVALATRQTGSIARWRAHFPLEAFPRRRAHRFAILFLRWLSKVCVALDSKRAPVRTTWGARAGNAGALLKKGSEER